MKKGVPISLIIISGLAVFWLMWSTVRNYEAANPHVPKTFDPGGLESVRKDRLAAAGMASARTPDSVQFAGGSQTGSAAASASLRPDAAQTLTPAPQPTTPAKPKLPPTNVKMPVCEFDTPFEEQLQAAQDGDANAMCSVGKHYREENNTPEAFKFLTSAAQAGHPVAMYYLGGLWNAAEEDEAKLIYWLTQAGQKGHPDAQYDLAHVYFEKSNGNSNDNANDRNKKQAFYWFNASARNGSRDAQFFLGQMYEYGIGTRLNKRAALSWYQRAAKQGLPEAEVAVENLKEQGVS